MNSNYKQYFCEILSPKGTNIIHQCTLEKFDNYSNFNERLLATTKLLKIYFNGVNIV